MNARKWSFSSFEVLGREVMQPMGLLPEHDNLWVMEDHELIAL